MVDYLNEFPKCGYKILRNALSEPQTTFGRNCISEKGLVNYHMVDDYINRVMFPIINRDMNWEGCVYSKFRYSDNNNSTDASVIHRDIICRHPKGDEGYGVYPVFTCLSYLDRTVMEVIPYSHTRPVMSFTESLNNWFSGKSETLTINVGDLVVFHSMLLHRGIFTENLPHRRLLQVFEVYPSMEKYTKYNKLTKHIPYIKNSDDLKNMMIYFSKIKPIIYILNFIGFINSSTGNGWSLGTKEDECLILSSEGIQKRYKVNLYDKTEAGWKHPLNVYITKDDIFDVDKKDILYYKWELFTKPFIVYMGSIIIYLSILIYLIIRLYKLNKRNIK